jgi:hypothetical protein
MLSRFINSMRKISYVTEEGDLELLPEWCVRSAAIGYWMRSAVQPQSRLLGFLVGPCRDYVGVFVTLGSIIAGAEKFRSALTWDRFVVTGRDQEIHWKDQNATYSGNILGSEDFDGTTVMRLIVTKSRKKGEIGTHKLFSRPKFEQCSFSIDRPQSVKRSSNQLSNLRKISSSISQSWIDHESSEVLYLGTLSKFRDCSELVRLRLSQRVEITLKELLEPEQTSTHVISKLKIEPPRREFQNAFPLVIQDGVSAYRPDSENNMLFLLSRDELGDSVVKEDLQFVEETFADTSELTDALGISQSGLDFCAYIQDLG